MLAKCPRCGALSAKDSPVPQLPVTFTTTMTPGMRHHTLLNSNEPPDEADLRLIQSALSQADARLPGLDEGIARLQAQLKQLEEDRASVSSYRARNYAILSPLRRLPVEVLGEIFSWTLRSPQEQWDREMFDRTDSPWVLTHVSSQWREVCISIPSLWSKVAINYSENQNPSSAYPLSVINAHIRRSHKLKIHFLGCGTVDPHPQIETFQLLLHHAPRWEEFCVEITPALVPLLAQLQDRLPSLLRLWINWEGPESQTGVQSVECFQTAPSLVDFGVFNEHAFVPFSFPIAQLTRYEFDGPWGMHSGVLRLASSLVEARILINFDEAPWPDPHEPIDLIHLRRLYVSNFRVLNYLRAPALDELAIWVSEDEPVEIPQLLAFIERSARSESLRNLCLKGSPDKETGVTILQKLPCITEFSLILRDSLEARTRIHALMLALTVSPGNAVVSPQLHALFLGCSDEGYVEYDVYLAMLKSRWTEQGCALQRAALATEEGPGPDPATLLGLMALRRDGLDILLVEGTAARYEMYAWSHAAPWN